MNNTQKNAQGLPLWLPLWLALFSVGAAHPSAYAESFNNPCNGGTQTISQPGLGGIGHIDPGVGGTGHTEPGLGGTGQEASLPAQYWVYGVVTGFASVCVNGLELHYNDTTPVEQQGQVSTINALQKGQLVRIQATVKNQGLWSNQISIEPPALVGPITRVEPGKRLWVMDRAVDVRHLPTDPNWKPGQNIAVSGFDNPQGVYATHIQSLKAHGQTLGAGPNQAPTFKLRLNHAAQFSVQVHASQLQAGQVQLFGHTLVLPTNTQAWLAKHSQDQLVVLRGKTSAQGQPKLHALDWIPSAKALQRGGDSKAKYSGKDQHENAESQSGKAQEDAAKATLKMQENLQKQEFEAREDTLKLFLDTQKREADIRQDTLKQQQDVQKERLKVQQDTLKTMLERPGSQRQESTRPEPARPESVRQDRPNLERPSKEIRPEQIRPERIDKPRGRDH